VFLVFKSSFIAIGKNKVFSVIEQVVVMS